MSKSNKCPIDSSSSSDKAFGNYQHRPHAHHANKADNPLSHICKYLDVSDSRKSSKDNVELALEVEINESLKHVLTNPDFNSSDLLDVTIIRPSDSDTTHETTVALNKDEVRDFISLVEQHHKHQNDPNHNEKSKEKNEDNTSVNSQKEKSQKHRSYKGNRSENKHKKDFERLEESQYHGLDDKDDKIGDNPKHVYATMNTFDKLRHSLPCQNKGRDNDKPGTPCMCQHCGVVGVLVQSQKGPIAPFPPLEESPVRQLPRRTIRPRDATPPRRDIKRRLAEIKRKQSADQLQLLHEINSRIKSLEKRIAIQEETAVPREYLKHILHKILTQYNSYKVPPNQAVMKLKNNATQYSTKSISESAGHRNTHSIHSDRKKREEDTRKCFQIHAVLDDHPKWLDNSKNKGSEGKTSSLGNDASTKFNKDHLYWLWGEEVVKPGCDLRNKILKLLEDKLHKNTCDTSNQSEPTKSSDNHTPQPTLLNRPEKPNINFTDEGIKVEKDEKTIFLNDVPHDSKSTSNQFGYLLQGSTQLPITDNMKDDNCTYSRPVREPPLPTNINRFSNFRNITPRTNYPFDLKKTIDDSTFKKNIEAQKEKHKEKPPPAPVEEKYFNAYATNSITTESQASMNFILQRMKNNAKILESGLPREREEQLETAFKIPDRDRACSIIKENLNRGGFRLKKEVQPVGEVVDVKFINPKIRQWSEESSTSEDKIMRQKVKSMIDKKDNITLQKKESLIYKLDFLKNLARNKSTDQSRVLNKIWNQAKSTAKSKKDAVYIKIPFKNVNTCENQNNLIEMHLTLEELETVVKSTNKGASTPHTSQHHVHVQSYKSTSEIDFGQRKHQEMKYANRELLKRRQLSAKANRNKNRRIFV